MMKNENILYSLFKYFIIFNYYFNININININIYKKIILFSLKTKKKNALFINEINIYI